MKSNYLKTNENAAKQQHYVHSNSINAHINRQLDRSVIHGLRNRLHSKTIHIEIDKLQLQLRMNQFGRVEMVQIIKLLSFKKIKKKIVMNICNS